MPTLSAEALVAVLVVALGAALQGSVGLGVGLVAAPLVALLTPELVPGPLLVAATLLTGLMVIRERREVDLRGVRWALVGRVPGTILGAVSLALLPADWIHLVLGSVLLGCVLLASSPLQLRPTTLNLVGMGALSGFTGTSASVGGPPIALVYQHATGPQLRATLSGYFVVGTAFSVVALGLSGNFGWEELRGAALLAPGAVAGFWISSRTRKLFDRGPVRPTVLWLSALASGAVLVRGILHIATPG